MTILQKLQNKVKNKKNEIQSTPFKRDYKPILIIVFDSGSIDFSVH